jgi:hypothetical protein
MVHGMYSPGVSLGRANRVQGKGERRKVPKPTFPIHGQSRRIREYLSCGYLPWFTFGVLPKFGTSRQKRNDINQQIEWLLKEKSLY